LVQKPLKAAVIYQPGAPEVLKIEDRPVPDVQPGWVLIKGVEPTLPEPDVMRCAGP